MIRVMIVDDAAPYRFVLKAMTKTIDGIEVVAEAASAEEALAMVAGLKPDLVLMDIRLPGMSGPEGAAQMMQLAPDIRIVLMSADDPTDYQAFAANGGAAAFMPKCDITPETLRKLAAY